MTGLSARRWVVEGRVQGVGFRWYIQARARTLGVGGWVRNLPDGSVEVVGMASAASIGEFEAIVRRGPPGATVERLTSSDVPHDDVDAKSFHIKR